MLSIIFDQTFESRNETLPANPTCIDTPKFKTITPYQSPENVPNNAATHGWLLY